MALPRMLGRPKKSSNAGALAVLMLVGWGLGGCSSVPDYANPIEWYRDLSGVSKNDTQDTGQRNQQNLQAGGAAPYPNLGTVPQTPDQAMSTIDREALQKGLVADRANARYSDEELRQGHSVPPLPGQPPTQTADAQGAAATPGAAAASGTAAVPAQAGGPRPGAPTKGSQAPPQESPLTTPSVRSLPQGETPNAPPPAPGGAPKPQQQAALPPATTLPTTLPLSPAARPVLPADPSEQPAVMRGPRGRAPSVTLQAAEIGFAGDGRTLSAEDNQRLAEAAKLQKQGGGSLRVIGYTRRGYGPDAAREDLASFGTALDRANTVAQALTKLGVPASRITVQAEPEQARGGLEAGEAEVLLDY